MNSLRKATQSGVRWSSTAGASVAVLQIAQMAVLGRLLGPAPFGLMALVLIVTSVMTQFRDAGVPEYVVHRQNLGRVELSTLFWFNVLVGLGLYCLLALVAPLIALGFNAPELARLLPVAGLAFIISSFATVYRALCQQHFHFGRIAATDIGGALINLLVSLLCVLVYDMGVWALVWGFLGGIVARTLGYLGAVRQVGFVPGLHFQRQAVVGYLRFGGYWVPAMLIDTFRARIDQIFVGIFFSPQVLGYYSMAASVILQLVQHLNNMLSGVALPILSRVQHRRSALRQGFLHVMRLAAVVYAPVMLGIVVVTPTAVPLIFGEQWLPMIPIMQVLAVYAMLRALVLAANNVVVAKGRANWVFRWNLALLMLTPPVAWAAGQGGAAIYLAVAMAGLQLLALGVHCRIMVQPLLGRCVAHYLRAVSIPVALAVGMAVLVWGAGMLPGMAWLGELSRLVALVSLGVLIYTGLMVLFQRATVEEALALLLGKGPLDDSLPMPSNASAQRHPNGTKSG